MGVAERCGAAQRIGWNGSLLGLAVLGSSPGCEPNRFHAALMVVLQRTAERCNARREGKMRRGVQRYHTYLSPKATRV